MQHWNVPDEQIKEVADQFEKARSILAEPRTSGVVWATINASIVAVELYLKSLHSRERRVPLSDDGDWEIVRVDPSKPNHCLTCQLREMNEDLKSNLEYAYSIRAARRSGTLMDALERLEGVFKWSRYPFSVDRPERYEYELLMDVTDFLRDHIDHMEERSYFID